MAAAKPVGSFGAAHSRSVAPSSSVKDMQHIPTGDWWSIKDARARKTSLSRGLDAINSITGFSTVSNCSDDRGAGSVSGIRAYKFSDVLRALASFIDHQSP